MSFLNFRAWQVLALLALAAAAIVGLYLLKPPPQRLVVSSTMLWSRVLRERRRRSDRWRWWLSLLLALSIGLSMALAISRPELRALSGEARRIAVVLDNSATMAARTSDGQTRWDHAVEMAREILRLGSPGSEYMIADTSGEITTPSFEDRETSLNRLEALRVPMSRRGEFPGLAFDGADLFYISDGVLIDPAGVPPQAWLLSVFETADNVGITAFAIRPQPASPDRFEAFLEVVSSSPATKTVSIELSGSGQHRLSRTIDLESGQTLAQIFDLEGFPGGPIRATVATTGDSLDADNVVYSYLPARRVIRAVLVTPGSLFLETLLDLDPKIDHLLLRPEGLGRLPAADVYLFDRFAPAQPPGRPFLLFDPPEVGWLAGTRREIQFPDEINGDSGHPLLRSVSLHDLVIERATFIRSDDGTRVVGSSQGPLVVAGENPVRYVHVGFSLQDSNFALLSGFPIFLSNALTWLTGEPSLLPRSLGIVEVPGAGAHILSWEGDSVSATAGSESTYFETGEPGLYTAFRDDEQLVVAVNLADRTVTELNRSGFMAPILERRFYSSLGDSTTPQRGIELWILLAVVAAVLALGEWWSYHRRMTL